MKVIAIGDIIVPQNRQRADIDAKGIETLSASITDIGLLQPIVLRDDGKTLVCGERRLKAISALSAAYWHDNSQVQRGQIPFVCLSELDAEHLYQAELEENVCRVDLRWDQKAKAIAALHALRKQQSGGTQTITATASEILGKPATGRDVTDISNATLIAQFLDDPIVAAQPDQKTALKVIREELKNKERQRLSLQFDPTATPHQLFKADSLVDALQFSQKFDVVVTDPPYGIDIDTKDTFDTTEHEYDDSDEMFQRILKELPFVMFATMKANAHGYIFCDIRRFTEIQVAFELAGFSVWPRPLIWDKGNTGSFGNIEYGFRACYDAILFVRKGDRKVTAGYRDVINITQKTNLVHPAGKPPELFEELLKRSALPGDTVADYFAGSAPIFPAAQRLKLIAYGWENHDKYYPMAVETLKATIK